MPRLQNQIPMRGPVVVKGTECEYEITNSFGRAVIFFDAEKIQLMYEIKTCPDFFRGSLSSGGMSKPIELVRYDTTCNCGNPLKFGEKFGFAVDILLSMGISFEKINDLFDVIIGRGSFPEFKGSVLTKLQEIKIMKTMQETLMMMRDMTRARNQGMTTVQAMHQLPAITKKTIEYFPNMAIQNHHSIDSID